jgi:hypothetical protein
MRDATAIAAELAMLAVHSARKTAPADRQQAVAAQRVGGWRHVR